MNQQYGLCDDLDAYIATPSEEERAELAAASELLDIAHLRCRARCHPDRTQLDAGAYIEHQPAGDQLSRARHDDHDVGHTREISP